MKYAWSVALTAGLVLVAAAAQAQSLADVARQEQERRKAIERPARVYTDADTQKNAPLTTAAARPQPAADAAAADGAAADKDAAGKDQPAKDQVAKDQPKDEASWRASVEGAREDLARSRRLLSAMEQQLVSMGIQASSAALAGQQAPNPARQQEAAREVERLRVDVQKYADALSKLEGDARDKGVPPGWVR